MSEVYDSRPETVAHIKRVGALMRPAIRNLGERLAHHDASKLEEPDEVSDVLEDPSDVGGMSLMALIEMLCDWRAVTEQTHKPTDGRSIMQAFEADLADNIKRFEIDEQLASVLLTTARELNLVPRPSEERDLLRQQRETQRAGGAAKRRARARRAAMRARREEPPA